MLFLKKLKLAAKLTLLFVCLSSSTSLLANAEQPHIFIENDAGKAFRFHLNYQQQKDFQITLKDLNDFVLWKEEVIGKKKYSKKINLKNLPNGDYFMEVEDSKSVTICRVKIQNDFVSLFSEKPKSILKPSLQKTDAMVTLNIPNPEPLDTQIILIGADQTMLYNEKIIHSTAIKKIFNFDEVASGKYTFQTYLDGRLFKMEVKI